MNRSTRVGRDSMRVRSIPRTEISVSAWTSEFGSWARPRTTTVRSAPVRAGGAVGRPTSTKRVRAPPTSLTPSASAARPLISPARAGAAVASAVPAATSSAPAAVEFVVSTRAPGRFSSSHPRTWAAATGWVRNTATSSGRVPGRTSTENTTSSSVSARICSRSPVARASLVGATVPSTEFSNGTHA